MPDQPDLFLDCKGLICPMPVVKTRRAIKQIEIGQILVMVATDPGSVPDMEAWERQTRHELVLSEESEDGSFRFLIRKTH
ncbi:MAG: sulfurtransferase TusA family protein [Planctomycetota bacterium]|nr:sulfurtransferase TusA family protein [Planctomycetota bacterium]